MSRHNRLLQFNARSLRNAAGFTLMEIVLATGLLGIITLVGSYVLVQSQSAQMKTETQLEIDRMHLLSMQEAQNPADLMALIGAGNPGLRACFEGNAVPGTCAQYHSVTRSLASIASSQSLHSSAQSGSGASGGVSGGSGHGNPYGQGGYGPAGGGYTPGGGYSPGGGVSAGPTPAPNTCAGQSCNVITRLDAKFSCTSNRCLDAEFKITTPSTSLSRSTGSDSAFVFSQRTSSFKMSWNMLTNASTTATSNIDFGCLGAGGLITSINLTTHRAVCAFPPARSCAQQTPIRGIAADFSLDAASCTNPDTIACDNATNHGVQGFGVFQSDSSCNNAPVALAALGALPPLGVASAGACPVGTSPQFQVQGYHGGTGVVGCPINPVSYDGAFHATIAACNADPIATNPCYQVTCGPVCAP